MDKNLEEQLNKLYEGGIPTGDGITMENPYIKYYKEQIAGFIDRNFLPKSTLEEIVKELEGTKRQNRDGDIAFLVDDSYNLALDQAIELIKKRL